MWTDQHKLLLIVIPVAICAAEQIVFGDLEWNKKTYIKGRREREVYGSILRTVRQKSCNVTSLASRWFFLKYVFFIK